MRYLKTEVFKSYKCPFSKYSNGYVSGNCNLLGIVIGAYKTKRETFKEMKRLINREKLKWNNLN